jgi:autotransporter-associated beta strand protein
MRATSPLFIFRSFLPSGPCWWLGCSFLLGTAGSSPAGILFSGQQDIAIPQNFDGVYIQVNLSQSTHVVSSAGGWHLNPFFGGIGIANSPTFQPVRSGTGSEDTIIRIAATSVIDGSATFASGWGGSGAEDESGHLGGGALQFADGKAGYLGFQLDTGAVPLYGWMSVVLTANGNGVIQSWAYDDSGAAILAGANGQAGQRVVTGVQETPTSAATAGNSILLASGGKVTFDDGATGGSFSGTIEGAGEIQIAGSGGLRLSGANPFTGTATVQENSKLIVADRTNLGSAAVALGNLSVLVFESSASNNGGTNTFSNTISLNGSAGVLENAGTGTVEVTGAVAGSGALTKHGSGNLTLSGTNSYTGATTVTAGLLTVNGDNSSSVLTTVGAGATLGGSGTIGALVVESGATIAPGNSPGTLTVSGNVTWQAGGNYNWQLVDALGTAGSGWDTLAISGELDLTALSSANPFNLNLWSLSSAEATAGGAQSFDSGGDFSWTIATAAGGITGFDAADFSIHTGATNGTNGFTNDLTGGAFSLAVVDGNKLNLVYQQTSAVPEPSSHLALIALGSAGLLNRRRLKRKA